MRIKKGMKLNHTCGEYFVVPMGEENIDFSKLISLNEPSLLLWKKMEQGEFTAETLVEVLCQEYEIDRDTALQDAKELIETLMQENIIE